MSKANSNLVHDSQLSYARGSEMIVFRHLFIGFTLRHSSLNVKYTFINLVGFVKLFFRFIKDEMHKIWWV